MTAFVMLKACGCVWGIETRTQASAVNQFQRAAVQSGRSVALMDHDEARACLFVCDHRQDGGHGEPSGL